MWFVVIIFFHIVVSTFVWKTKRKKKWLTNVFGQHLSLPRTETIFLPRFAPRPVCRVVFLAFVEFINRLNSIINFDAKIASSKWHLYPIQINKLTIMNRSVEKSSETTIKYTQYSDVMFVHIEFQCRRNAYTWHGTHSRRTCECPCTWDARVCRLCQYVHKCFVYDHQLIN